MLKTQNCREQNTQTELFMWHSNVQKPEMQEQALQWFFYCKCFVFLNVENSELQGTKYANRDAGALQWFFYLTYVNVETLKMDILHVGKKLQMQ